MKRSILVVLFIAAILLAVMNIPQLNKVVNANTTLKQKVYTLLMICPRCKHEEKLSLQYTHEKELPWQQNVK